MIVGITGVFGSGKSTAAEEFRKLGFKVINADEVGHKLLGRADIKNKVIGKFGKSILTNNKIDRRKLKNIVFYDKGMIMQLNRIIHQEIIKEIKIIIKKSKNDKIIVDGALLIEAGFKELDKLIVVKINNKNRMKRLLKKGKYNKEEINNIIKSQLPQKEKLKHADFVVDNDKSISDVRKQIKEIYSKIK